MVTFPSFVIGIEVILGALLSLSHGHTHTPPPSSWPRRGPFCCAKTQRGRKSSQTILSIQLVSVNGGPFTNPAPRSQFLFFRKGALTSVKSACKASLELHRGAIMFRYIQHSHGQHKRGIPHDAPLLTQGLPSWFRPAWLDGMCLNHTRGGGGSERIKACKSYFLPAPIMYSVMFIQAFFKLTKQFEESIFIWGTWHFMSFIGGEENQYLQVGFLVLLLLLFFRFESYKLFGVVCLWIKTSWNSLCFT